MTNPRDKIITIERTCSKCVEVFPIEMTAQQFVDWQEGKLLQNVCPNMSINDRELLISSICSECYDRIFK